MRFAIRVLKITVTAVVALAAIGGTTFFAVFPRAPEPRELHVAITAERVERGRYLAEHVTACMDCHSNRDWSRYGGPVRPGSLGAGGDHFGKDVLPDLPGDVWVPNITPARMSGWTDGELVRAFTEGVSRDGRALFPLMPYGNFRHLCDRDAEALVAYLRTLAPVSNTVPRSQIDFPVNVLARMAPGPADPWKCPDEIADPVERGRVLTTLAGCQDCHTRSENGEPVGPIFSGGMEFHLPTGTVRPANITPDLDTGIGTWTRETFLARFHAQREAPRERLGAHDPQTVMPWSLYAGMTDEDLGAIFAYLRTVPAVRRQVQRWEPATPTPNLVSTAMPAAEVQ